MVITVRIGPFDQAQAHHFLSWQLLLFDSYFIRTMSQEGTNNAAELEEVSYGFECI